jgi:hypothetical protein
MVARTVSKLIYIKDFNNSLEYLSLQEDLWKKMITNICNLKNATSVQEKNARFQTLNPVISKEMISRNAFATSSIS